MPKVRVDVYRNDGKKSQCRRFVFSSGDPWSSVLAQIADKLKLPLTDIAVLYSDNGVILDDVDALAEGESLFYDGVGGAFIPILTATSAPSPTSANSFPSSAPPLPIVSGGPTSASLSSFVYAFKFIIVGSSSVGKSCLLLQFTDRRFNTTMEPTIGVDFGTVIVPIHGVPVKLQIWDTAGQEDFRALSRAYYREAAGAFLVYDITNRPSYQRLQSWLDDVRRNTTNDKIVITLLGNKSDDTKRRCVDTAAGEEFSQQNNLLFFETSARTGYNVEKVYQRITTGLIDVNRRDCGVTVNSDANKALKIGASSSQGGSGAAGQPRSPGSTSDCC